MIAHPWSRYTIPVIVGWFTCACSVHAGHGEDRPAAGPITAHDPDDDRGCDPRSLATTCFDPVPAIARGPAIPAAGYLVREVRDGLFWLTNGSYSSMFLTTGLGVIVVDVPQPLAPHLLAAIASVTREPITHVIYSHHHADHIAGTAVVPAGATIIAQDETAAFLIREADPNRPVPSVTFRDSYTLTVGTQTLVLDYHGPNHDAGNLFIYAPRQKVLMVVDVLWPGWSPFTELGSAVDIAGYVAVHDQVLAYDFDTLIAGHETRLGGRSDVETDRRYIADLQANGVAALAAVDPAALRASLPDPTNDWAFGATLIDQWSQVCAGRQLSAWRGRLGGVDVFAYANCKRMITGLREGDIR